jgi:protein O-mannosyl-transferase
MRKPATNPNPSPPSASVPVMSPSRFPPWLIAVALVLVTIALYWPATSHDFVSYDDNVYVTSNVHVQAGLTWESLKWAFGKPEDSLGYWHPLTLLSHMADCELFGLNPWGHHLTSVLLHALNAALVFVLLQQLTGAKLRSLFVAALFSVHPLRVESVVWVAERKDLLSGFFGLLALAFYARYARKPATAEHPKPAAREVSALNPRPAAFDYVLALLFFALGLMSKPMLVTWPFLMLLLDYWPLERFEPGRAWRLVTEKIPFFALTALTTVAAFVTQERAGALGLNESLTLGARGGNALISYCRYLMKMCWPADLAVFYPHPGQWPTKTVLLAGGLILGISVVLFVERRRYPFLLTGWLWFCGTLGPVIGLVQVGEFAMADRFTYIPSLGVLILTIWGAYELARRRRHCVIALSAAGLAGIVLCIVLTQRQLKHWENTEALFRHALEVTENNHVAHVGLGTELLRQDKIEQAITQYMQVIHLKPDYALAHNNLGFALLRKGQIQEAITQYQEAIRLKPDYPLARNNLGNALYRQGRDDEAISQYQEAIRLKPDYADAHNDLGLALYRKGRSGEAISQFRETLRLKPAHAAARKNLDFVLGAQADSSRQPASSPNP